MGYALVTCQIEAFTDSGWCHILHMIISIFHATVTRVLSCLKWNSIEAPFWSTLKFGNILPSNFENERPLCYVSGAFSLTFINFETHSNNQHRINVKFQSMQKRCVLFWSSECYSDCVIWPKSNHKQMFVFWDKQMVTLVVLVFLLLLFSENWSYNR